MGSGSLLPSDRTRGNGQKLEHGKFQLNKRKSLMVTALEQVAQKGCGVSFSGDIQDRRGHFHLQPAVGNLL